MRTKIGLGGKVVNAFLSLTVFGLFLAGCADKAKSDFARCIQLDIQGDVGSAWDACNSAVAADPTSESGKGAASKLVEMKPKYDPWKLAQDKQLAEAQRAREQAEARAAADMQRAEARRIARIREKVYKSRGTAQSHCRGKGLGEAYDYSGGTDSENAEVARADGCVPVYPGSPHSVLLEQYCCPEGR